MVLQHELWHEPCKIRLLPLITFVSDVFYGFRTQTMLPMLMYDSELALHRSSCRSSKQDGCVASDTWQGWATDSLSVKLSDWMAIVDVEAGRPGRPGRPGCARWSQICSHTTLNWGWAAWAQRRVSIRPGSRTLEALRGRLCSGLGHDRDDDESKVCNVRVRSTVTWELLMFLAIN